MLDTVTSWPIHVYIGFMLTVRAIEDRHTVPGVHGHSSIPLSHSGNVGTRIGLQQKLLEPILLHFVTFAINV